MWSLASNDQIWCSPGVGVSYSSYHVPLPYPNHEWGLQSPSMDLDNVYNKVGKKRRRTTNAAQRRAANIRERRRMFNLNESFDRLRTQIPTFPYEKRLSRIETLRLAISYISFMDELLSKTDSELRSFTQSNDCPVDYHHPSQSY